jgi:hypothetical protein
VTKQSRAPDYFAALGTRWNFRSGPKAAKWFMAPLAASAHLAAKTLAKHFGDGRLVVDNQDTEARGSIPDKIPNAPLPTATDNVQRGLAVTDGVWR